MNEHEMNAHDMNEHEKNDCLSDFPQIIRQKTEGRAYRRDSIGTVSYTHLTLPTTWPV